VILEHARQLRSRGHDVRIYYPLLPYIELLHHSKSPLKKLISGQLKPFLLNLLHWYTRAPWYPYDVPVTPVLWMGAPFLKPADVTVATTWVTAYDVERLGPQYGRRAHFIQAYERWPNADPDLVDGAYRLPMPKITIAPWLTALLRDSFGRETLAEIPNGVDMELFRPPAARPASPMRVLMIFHEQSTKGTPEGLEVLERIHRRFPEAAISLFGPTPFPACPAYAEFQLSPSAEDIARHYRAAHIYLCPSLVEGWHLPPMEAMASKCAVVATTVGSIPSLYDGDNMLVAEPGDVDALEEKVAFLLGNPAECARIAERGYATIRAYTWEIAASKLERALAG